MHNNRLLLFLFALLLSIHAFADTQYATPYYFSTLAGDSSLGSNDGTGAAARFWGPGPLIALPDGSVYVADYGNQLVRRVSSMGLVTTVLGEAGIGIPYTEFGMQRTMGAKSLSFDASGALYLSTSSAIRKVSSDGTLSLFVGDANTMTDTDDQGASARFSALRNITADRAGNFYAISSAAIRKITPSGAVSTLAGKANERGYADGSGSSARFGVLTGLACDTFGNIYAIDRSAHVIRKITPDGAVSTLAGRQTPIDQYFGEHADGSSQNAQFYLPEEMAIDALNNLYVGDIFTIRKVTPNGTVTTLAGGPEQQGSADGLGAAARFGRITGLVVAANGDLIVSDGYNHTIRRVTPAGLVTTLAGQPPSATTGTRDGLALEARFSDQIAGVAIAASGNVYVADAGNHTIRKITPAGIVSTLAGQPGITGSNDGTGNVATFTAPQGIAIDAEENIYVTEPESYIVRKITPGGIVSTLAGLAGAPGSINATGEASRFWNPSGIAVDDDGNIYVTDIVPFLTSSGYRNVTRRISRDGTVTTVANITQSQLNTGVGDSLAVDTSGNVYRFLRYSLARITQAGVLITLAGTEETRGIIDGDGPAASFINPGALTIDASGNLYTSDAQTVRKVTPNGTVSTLAGIPTAHGYANGTGREARFNFQPWHNWIAIDDTGNLLISSGSSIRRGQPAASAVITLQPQSHSVTAGSNVQFTVTATAIPAPTYQWYLNGHPFNGATDNTLSFTNARTTDAGNYTVVVTNALDNVTSDVAKLTVTAASTPSTPSSGGSSGGGGAPSTWFLGMLGALAFARRWRTRTRAQHK